MSSDRARSAGDGQERARSPRRDPAGLEAALEKVTTAILSDSLDAAGRREQVLAERLAPLVPGTRVFGRAATVEFLPSDDLSSEHPYDDAIAFIDGLRPGEIVVIATGRSNRTAFWGELFSAAALGAGARGVITDGNLRDSDKIVALGFPAFSASRRPLDFRGRMRLSRSGEPVSIGDVRIDPGDLVMADDDGVVVVPASDEDAVIERASARASAETTVLAELLGGDSLRAVWDRHRVL